MKRLIEFFVNQTLFGDLLSIFIIITGIGAALLIRKEVFPNISFDVLTVTTVFPGSSAAEIEQLITSPLERELKEVDGVKKMQSTSVEGRSLIALQLDPDSTNDEKARSDVREVVDRFVGELPEGAEKPVVTSLESKQQPILEVPIAGPLSPIELRNVAKRLERELEEVSGVAKVTPFAVRDLEIHVEADPRKLAAYKITLEDIIKSLRLQNIDISGGTIETQAPEANEREQLVRTLGQFNNLEELKNTYIRANEIGRGFRIRDVAEVKYDLARPSLLNRANGKSSLRLTVMKKEKADAIEVVDAVKARMAELQPSLPSGVTYGFINDLSTFIRRRLSILTGNLVLGFGLVILVLILLMPWRVSMIVASGEPFAFLGALVLFYLMGNSINLISILGFIIVSGILVDDSIVVTENAVRLMQEGMPPKQAAVEGTYQVWAAVNASVLTAMTAFLPMMFMSGIFGKFTREIPIGVLLALLVSAYECYFILPGHVAHWISPKKLERIGRFERLRKILAKPMETWEQRMVPWYRGMLGFVLRFRYVVAFSTLVFVIFTAFIGVTKVRFILFPPEDIEIFMIRTLAPEGTSLERTERLLLPVEEIIAKLPKIELENYLTMIGIHAQDANQVQRRGPECGQIIVYLTPSNTRKRSANEIIEDLRKSVGTPPGLVRVSFERINPGPPVGKPISIGVRANRYEDILPVVRHLKEIVQQLPGATDVEDTYIPGKNELQVHVNASEAAAAGVSVASIGNTVRAAYEGIVATKIRRSDEEIDVKVSLNRPARISEKTLRLLSVPNATGQLIPLSRITSISSAQGISTYEHEGGLRVVRVQGQVDTAVTSAQEIKRKVSALLPDIKKQFPGVYIDFGGESKDTEESFQSLARAFAVAFMGIVLILVATFKNLVQPVLISLSIPLGMVAVVWVFLAHGKPLSFMAMLGVIALSGVIVNNGIVLIDFVNQERARGIGKRQSIINAGGMRLRPIFLTMITTVLGVLPTAYGIGGEDKFVIPIALALGWGLFFGSGLATFITPAAIAIADDLSDFISRIFRGKPEDAPLA